MKLAQTNIRTPSAQLFFEEISAAMLASFPENQRVPTSGSRERACYGLLS
jgi:hypothetical protein